MLEFYGRLDVELEKIIQCLIKPNYRSFLRFWCGYVQGKK